MIGEWVNRDTKIWWSLIESYSNRNEKQKKSAFLVFDGVYHGCRCVAHPLTNLRWFIRIFKKRIPRLTMRMNLLYSPATKSQHRRRQKFCRFIYETRRSCRLGIGHRKWSLECFLLRFQDKNTHKKNESRGRRNMRKSRNTFNVSHLSFDRFEVGHSCVCACVYQVNHFLDAKLDSSTRQRQTAGAEIWIREIFIEICLYRTSALWSAVSSCNTIFGYTRVTLKWSILNVKPEAYSRLLTATTEYH